MKKIDIETIKGVNFASNSSRGFALFRNIQDVFLKMTGPMLVDGFVVAYIVRGQIKFKLDEKEYIMGEGAFASFHPRNIIEGIDASPDIELRGFYGTKEYAQRIGSLLNLDWTSKEIIGKTHSIYQFTEESINTLNMYFGVLEKLVDRPDTINKWKSISLVIASLVYQYTDMMENTQSNIPQRKYSQTESLIERFLALLTDPNHPYVSIKEYAEELCVTPKYFSTVCKQITGKTATAIINDQVIKSAKILLRNNTLSIKQISDMLNFANQSHFGRFFARHVGMSPMQYRESEHK